MSNGISPGKAPVPQDQQRFVADLSRISWDRDVKPGSGDNGDALWLGSSESCVGSHGRFRHHRHPDYTPSTSRFTGKINWVQIDLGDDDHDHYIDPDERLRVAMARQ